MAARAVTGNVVVIKIGRRKRDRRVTVLAGIAAWNMGWTLADRRQVVVTADATAEHLRVIDFKHRSEIDDIVAILTDIGSRRMIERLADGIDGIVATDAVPGDIVVIEIGW